MAFKLIESPQRRWRAVNAPHLVALVRAGATKAASSNDQTTNLTTSRAPMRDGADSSLSTVR